MKAAAVAYQCPPERDQAEVLFARLARLKRHLMRAELMWPGVNKMADAVNRPSKERPGFTVPTWKCSATRATASFGSGRRQNYADRPAFDQLPACGLNHHVPVSAFDLEGFHGLGQINDLPLQIPTQTQRPQPLTGFILGGLPTQGSYLKRPFTHRAECLNSPCNVNAAVGKMIITPPWREKFSDV